MKRKIHLTQGSARVADLKLILLLGFITLFMSAGAQLGGIGGTCLQMQPNTYYSRIISSTKLDPGRYIQSDYDAANDHLYVPSTFGTSWPTEAYLTRIHGKGYMDNGWGNHYAFPGENEHAMATKHTTVNDDIVVVGTTLGTNNNTVIYVMMVQNNGTFLWAKYFEQSNMNADSRVLVTEATNKDIIVAASSASSNDHVLIRL